MRRFLKWSLRVNLNRLGLWDWLERKRVEVRLSKKWLHEDDFYLFEYFDASERIFVDVGANIGQSAVAFSSVRPECRIISFEPNTLLEHHLDSLKKKLGDKYDFKMFGLGKSEKTQRFYYPVVQGVPFTQELTSAKEYLLSKETIERTESITGKRDFEIEELDLHVVPFDSLEIQPSFIKMDTQNTELEVIEGMRQTLETCQPVLMIEITQSLDKFCKHLEEYGYRPFIFDRKRGAIAPSPKEVDLNVFFLTGAHLEETTSNGLKLIQEQDSIKHL